MGFRLEAVKKPFRSHHQCRSLQLSRGVKLKEYLRSPSRFFPPFLLVGRLGTPSFTHSSKRYFGVGNIFQNGSEVNLPSFFLENGGKLTHRLPRNSKCEQKARKRSLFTMIWRGVWTKIIDMLQSIAPVLKSTRLLTVYSADSVHDSKHLDVYVRHFCGLRLNINHVHLSSFKRTSYKLMVVQNIHSH